MICDPPTKVEGESGKEDFSRFDSELKLVGKVGLEDLAVSVLSNGKTWTIEKGFEDLTIKTEGNFIAEANLEGTFEFEFSGDDTKVVVGGDGDESKSVLVLEALKEKMFPIAMISYDGKWNAKIGPQSDDVTMPLTIGIMVYTDIYGNITAGAELYCSFNQPIDFEADIFRDGKFLGIGAADKEEVNSGGEDKSASFDWGVKFEVKADVDFQILGSSVMLYVGNLNVLELSLVRFGAEAQGSIAFDSADFHEDNYGFSAQGLVRIYAELFELDIKFKAKTKWNINGSLEFDLGPLFKFDLGCFGNTNVEASTYYNPSTMYSNNILAGDAYGFYYKDEQGNLIAEQDSYKTIIYDEEFFVICGIDDSYLYLLKRSESNSSLYDLYRIRKDGTSERRIVEGIKNFMECDESYFYYIKGNNNRTIVRLRRSDLHEDELARYDMEVVCMKSLGDNFYVVSSNGSGWFSSTEYYLMDKEGNILEKYGESPDVSEYMLYDYGGFYYAVKLTSMGFLRNTANDVQWLSLDKKTHAKAESLAGWSGDPDVGIMVIGDGTGEYNYQINYYAAENGELRSIVGVNSNQAHFTFVGDDYDTWYYIDTVEEGLAMCSLDKNFENKKILEILPYDEFPVDLETCGMMLIDGTIWFYQMPDNYTANVLYRYSLY
jgi:hypothetical protein